MKNVLRLTLIVLGCFFVSSIYSFAKGPDENTMAIWLFNETKGNTVQDVSGNGHKLDVEGDHEWVSGTFGNALYFTQNAFVEYKSHPDLSFKNGMTIEFWLNLDDITPQTVVGIPRKEDEYVVAAYEQGKGFYMGPYVNNGGWVGPLDSKVVSPYGEWHHHATTYDGRDLKVYVDGKLTGSMAIPGPMNQTDAPFRISNSCCDGRFFVGALDEMRLSNIPRTEAEIKSVMDRGLSSLLAVESSNRLATTWGKVKF